jgi:hypothetical protein
MVANWIFVRWNIRTTLHFKTRQLTVKCRKLIAGGRPRQTNVVMSHVTRSSAAWASPPTYTFISSLSLPTYIHVHHQPEPPHLHTRSSAAWASPRTYTFITSLSLPTYIHVHQQPESPHLHTAMRVSGPTGAQSGTSGTCNITGQFPEMQDWSVSWIRGFTNFL